MKDVELKAYKRTNFLSEGHVLLLKKIRPFFLQMIDELISFPENCNFSKKMKSFEKCFIKINHHEEEIETVERETILNAIYEIGTIVGLEPETEFAEQWRGDW